MERQFNISYFINLRKKKHIINLEKTFQQIFFYQRKKMIRLFRFFCSFTSRGNEPFMSHFLENMKILYICWYLGSKGALLSIRWDLKKWGANSFYVNIRRVNLGGEICKAFQTITPGAFFFSIFFFYVETFNIPY